MIPAHRQTTSSPKTPSTASPLAARWTASGHTNAIIHNDPTIREIQIPGAQYNPTNQWSISPRDNIGDALVELCRDLGLVHADRRGNPVFVRRNAAGEATGIETLTAAQLPDARGGFWMSWEPDWPASVILADSALDALSILSLHLVPAMRKGCAVVSTGTVTASIPKWIQAWNPSRIFCAWNATPNGDHHAQHLQNTDTRVVRLRPAPDAQDWNDMLIRDRAGEPLQTDDRPIG